MKIYAGNLSFDTSEDSLRNHFAQHGEVSEVVLITDRETGRPRGFGFVTMPNDNEARTAIQELDGKDLDGRSLKVNEAKPRTDAPRGGGRSW
ncbi:MAG: RNA recognition motif domain-containing protein [Planctomycetota bacterium]